MYASQSQTMTQRTKEYWCQRASDMEPTSLPSAVQWWMKKGLLSISLAGVSALNFIQ